MTHAPLLAFDTSGPHLATALLQSTEIHGAQVLDMARGQAEALMPFLEETLAARGLSWSDLGAIAVGVGPGNFTGIRISVSAARGLALALSIPAIGVSMFEVMAFGRSDDTLLVSLPAPRERAYLQPFRSGRPDGMARLIDPLDPPGEVPTAAVIGHRAAEIAAHLDSSATPANLIDIPSRIARIGGHRLRVDQEAPSRPAPLYVRAADASPPSDPPPVILP